MRWNSGSGQHEIEELRSVDASILVCDGSLGRVGEADVPLLKLAAEELAALGSAVLLAAVNCHPELRYFISDFVETGPRIIRLASSSVHCNTSSTGTRLVGAAQCCCWPMPLPEFPAERLHHQVAHFVDTDCSIQVRCSCLCRSFGCQGLPADIPVQSLHLLPYSLFSVHPDR